MIRQGVPCIRFFHGQAIYPNLPVDQLDVISRHSDHALHEMLRGIYGIVKNNNVPSPHPLIGHHPAAGLPSIPQLVDQQIVADQERVLHGFRGNLKRLHHKTDYEYRDDYRRKQRLDRWQQAMILSSNYSRWGRVNLWRTVLNDGNGFSVRQAGFLWMPVCLPQSLLMSPNVPGPAGRHPVQLFSSWTLKLGQ